MRGTVHGCRESANDNEFDIRACQNGEQAREVRHFVSTFNVEFRTASANRRAEIIFSTRSVVVSLRFSTSKVRSTSFLYASITGEESRLTGNGVRRT
jgi:hypothetical protein